MNAPKIVSLRLPDKYNEPAFGEVMVKVIADDQESKALLVPKQKTAGAAGWDLVASEDATIDPHRTGKVPCGFKMELPPGWEAQVRPRSSMSLAGHIVMFGTIDDDYRGEVAVVIHNTNITPFVIKRGDRIAQMVFNRLDVVQLTRVDTELSTTQRGEGGFGSTGRSDINLNSGTDS
jgi:dUTP pyrophosphatase